MTWQILISPAAKAFLLDLDEEARAMFVAAFEMLKQQGPNLGEPFVKLITSSKHANMKELRRQRKGKIFRMLFAFDKSRRAVLLLGGDKSQIGFDDFYTVNVPIADKLFDAHLATERAASSGQSSKKRRRKK